METILLPDKQVRDGRISDHEASGFVVFDPFGGSGSTLIACETTSRHARLIELDPKYVYVIVRRWQDYRGRKAVLEGDGREFEQVALERS